MRVITQKQDLLESILDTENSVLVHLDARKATVPAQFVDDYKLVVRVGLKMTPPMNLQLDDSDGIVAEISFGDTITPCVIPWEAIYAYSSEHHQERLVFDEDVPYECLLDAIRAAGITDLR